MEIHPLLFAAHRLRHSSSGAKLAPSTTFWLFLGAAESHTSEFFESKLHRARVSLKISFGTDSFKAQIQAGCSVRVAQEERFLYKEETVC